jgi:hypothetical protein
MHCISSGQECALGSVHLEGFAQLFQLQSVFKKPSFKIIENVVHVKTLIWSGEVLIDISKFPH